MEGFFNGDLVLFTSLKEGIKRLKEHLYIIDSINQELINDPYLKEEFGQKELERFRDFARRNEITVTTDHKPPKQINYPCISIGIGTGKEDEQRRLTLGDTENDQTSMINPEVLLGSEVIPRNILGPVTPISYEPSTGIVVFATTVSLQEVVQGQYVVDNVNNKTYPIVLVLSDQTLQIEPGSTPNLEGMTITSSISKVGATHKSVYCYENYSITAVAKDPVEAIYVFQIAMLILLRFKKELFEERGFAIQTFSYQPLQMGDDGSPNEVWFRQINLSGRVRYQWTNKISLPIDGVNSNLRISNEDGTETPTPPGVLPQVEGQGWEMASDPPNPDNK